jgi:hypothetical protein
MRVKVCFGVTKTTIQAVIDTEGAFRECPATAMFGTASQVTITVMSGFDHDRLVVSIGSRRKQLYARPARNPKSGPYLRGIQSVDNDCVMGARASLALSLFVVTVHRGAGIHEDTLIAKTQFKAQCVSVRVTRLVIRPD